MNDDDCPQCLGEPTYLGALGTTLHLRCRSCGWTWALPMTQAEVTEFNNDTMPMEGL